MSLMPSNTSYKAALEILMFYINNANLESALALLRDQEVSIDMSNDIGMTPLHQAVKVNNLSFVNLLLDYGANPNVKTEWSTGGETPIMIAAANGYYDIAKLLLDNGADPTIRNAGGIPSLHLATMNGHIDLALLIISYGMDPNTRDNFGNNASYWAERNGFPEYISLCGVKPITMNPQDNADYREVVDSKYFGFTADEKKKMAKGKKGKKKKK
ncbi:MAG: ankyrin repeat domain-containing protein [archaeon]|nr:ankyrin repeat domain-containing protein [archaeon]